MLLALGLALAALPPANPPQITCERGTRVEPEVTVEPVLHPGQDLALRIRNAGRCPQGVDHAPSVGWEQATEAGWGPVLREVDVK
ncbi:hypothetical protein [Solirubrobacter soli]|uniref:hypothetical protein n=1 Tax=Solirubrobacter soli TaxID=363832 RepID=UPI000411AF46|nr:hypothetical protein [Solirubrobacter soli]